MTLAFLHRMVLRPLQYALLGLMFGALTSLSIAQQEQTWTVNFKDTDIEEVIRFVAKITDKTIIIDPAVKGKVQVVSSRPVTSAQLYELFLSILDVQGFAAVESGNVTRIIPAKDARSAPVPVRQSNAPAMINSETITQVIQLENISAAKLIPVLRPLAPQQAHMAAYTPSNAIIISDTAANIARIREVIESVDRTAVEQTDIVRLEHAAAEEVANMLAKLQKNMSAGDQDPTKTLTVVPDKRTNSILINGDEMQRARTKALIRHLDTPLAQSGNVQVVYLEYANAKDLSAVLTKIVQNIEEMSTTEASKASKKAKASIEADEGTNSLIVTADADVMKSLQSVIKRLDIRRAQVLVEAIIVEMSNTDGKALGLQWLFLNSSGAYGSSRSNELNESISQAVVGSADPQAGIASAISGVPGQVLGIGRLDDDFSFNVVLNALNEDDDANILSTPSLLTLDNQEASITVGQNVPFITGSYSSTGSGSSNPDSPFQTIERENVGITLKVTPHINEGDSLVLEIVQEVSSLFGGTDELDASDIVTNERKIETKVLTDNGKTIILGGLIQDDVQSKQTKVPFLGDIPVLGRLFRSTASTNKKTHLMVFLRSTIVRDSKALDGATAEKYSLLRDRQLQRAGGEDLFSDEALPLLPEWQRQLETLYREQQQNSDVVIPASQLPVVESLPAGE